VATARGPRLADEMIKDWSVRARLLDNGGGAAPNFLSQFAFSTSVP